MRFNPEYNFWFSIGINYGYQQLTAGFAQNTFTTPLNLDVKKLTPNNK